MTNTHFLNLAKLMGKLIHSFVTVTKCVAIANLVTVAVSCNTSNKLHTGKSNSPNLQDSVMIDGDGNKYPVKKFADGKLWMTRNLTLRIAGSYCYGNSEDSCARYGRLYLWESAKQGCAILGEGWRLPALDEWQRLAGLYGWVSNDSAETRKRAYQFLLYSGSSLFNAVLSGGRDQDGQYARADAHGFYWTLTENDSSTAWFANFGKGSQSLYFQKDGGKTDAFAVRCVKSVDAVK